MTDEPFLGLGAQNRKGPGRPTDEIAGVEAALGHRLPSDYRDLLAWGDGWEGWIGEAYLRLHGLADLPWANDADFRQAFPGLVAIGGNGGLETYALDFRRGGSMSGVVAVDRNSSDERDLLPIAQTFSEALVRLQTGEFG